MMGRLEGRTVAATRDGDPGDALVTRLLDDGARVLVWPTLTIDPPRDPEPLWEAARTLSAYDWVAFTSPRAVEALADQVSPPTFQPRAAAVGRATAAALTEHGWTTHVLANGHGAAALAEAMAAAADLTDASVLFPASSLARPTLEDSLTALGAHVDRVEAYHVRPLPPDPVRVRADLAAGVDVVTFASPSAVHALAEALDGDLPTALKGTAVAAIGRTTAAALEELGVRDVTIGPTPGMDGLVEACVALTDRAPRKA